jgi:coenzyme F420-reducing hydrogenase gamma subunit
VVLDAVVVGGRVVDVHLLSLIEHVRPRAPLLVGLVKIAAVCEGGAAGDGKGNKENEWEDDFHRAMGTNSRPCVNRGGGGVSGSGFPVSGFGVAFVAWVVVTGGAQFAP